MIKVEYNNSSTETYPTLAEAEKGIQEVIAGCDFVVLVESIEDEATGKRYGCEWSMKLVEM